MFRVYRESEIVRETETERERRERQRGEREGNICVDFVFSPPQNYSKKITENASPVFVSGLMNFLFSARRQSISLHELEVSFPVSIGVATALQN